MAWPILVCPNNSHPFEWRLAKTLPVPRPTWFDTLASKTRRDLTRQASKKQLVAFARKHLPDKLAGVAGLGQRPILAVDATEPTESSHCRCVLAKEGRLDHQKGHMLLTHSNLRSGIPVGVRTETRKYLWVSERNSP